MITIDFSAKLSTSLLLFIPLVLHIWHSHLLILYYRACLSIQIPLPLADGRVIMGAKPAVLLWLCYAFTIAVVVSFVFIFESSKNGHRIGIALLVCCGCNVVAVIYSVIFIIDVYSRYRSLVIIISCFCIPFVGFGRHINYWVNW